MRPAFSGVTTRVVHVRVPLELLECFPDLLIQVEIAIVEFFVSFSCARTAASPRAGRGCSSAYPSVPRVDAVCLRLEH